MMQPHRGSVILAFGILGFLVCGLFGVAAWVMADNDLEQMNCGYMDPSGRDLTRTGRILGMVATAMIAIPLILVVLWAVAGIALSLSH